MKILILLIFIVTFAYSQQPPYLLFRNSNTIYLKWEFPKDKNHRYFNVYRNYENTDSWEKVNEKPLQFKTEFNEISKIAGEYYGSIYLSLMGIKKEKRNINQADIDNWLDNDETFNMLNALAISQDIIAELIGNTINDIPIVNTRVRYKITSFSNNIERDYIITPFIEFDKNDLIPPPEDVKLKPMNNSVIIEWLRDFEILNSGIAVNYNIYRAESITGPYEIINIAGILQGMLISEEVEIDTNYFNYFDANLSNGKTYYYYLTSVNSFGFESERSSVYEVIPNDNRPALPPGEITVEEFGGRIKIRWKNVSRVIPIGYEIYKSVGNNEKFKKVFPEFDLQMNNQITSWIDSDVVEGETYFYYLKSINSSFERSINSDTIIYIIDDFTPPSAPTGVIAIGDTGRIRLFWNKNKEADLLGYQIERSSDTRFATRFLVNDTPIIDTFFVDTVRKESQTDFAYFIYALDKRYNRSLPSERVIARAIDIVPPLIPSITNIYEEDGRYIVNWTKTPDIDFKAYRLYLSLGDTSSFSLITQTNRLSFSDRINERITHYFKVSAIDTTGNESKHSQIRKLLISEELPRTPDSVKITKENKYVLIEWSIPNDKKIAGFFIQRQYRGMNTPLVDLAVLKPDKSKFMDWDIDLNKGCTYFIYSRDEKWRLSVPVIVNYSP